MTIFQVHVSILIQRVSLYKFSSTAILSQNSSILKNSIQFRSFIMFASGSADDLESVAQEQPRQDHHVEPDPLRPLKLLSLGNSYLKLSRRTSSSLILIDGGGVRGLSSIIILENLMTKVNAARKEQGLLPKEPWQLFDMIGGTSTGGYVILLSFICLYFTSAKLSM